MIYIHYTEELSRHLHLFDYDEENPAFKQFMQFMKKQLEDDSFSIYDAMTIISLIKIKYPIKDIIDFFHEGYGIVFDELKKQKENRPHLELPETCVIPTYKEISEKKKAFDEYCEASNCPRPWLAEILILCTLNFIFIFRFLDK